MKADRESQVFYEWTAKQVKTNKRFMQSTSIYLVRIIPKKSNNTEYVSNHRVERWTDSVTLAGISKIEKTEFFKKIEFFDKKNDVGQ